MKQFTRRFKATIPVEGVIGGYEFIVWKNSIHRESDSEINREHCKKLAKGICLVTFKNAVYFKAKIHGKAKLAFVKSKLDAIVDDNASIEIELKGEFNDDDCYKNSNFLKIQEETSVDEVANFKVVSEYFNRLMKEWEIVNS